MRRLFEAFLRGLLQSKLKSAKVGARRYSLAGAHSNSNGIALIPSLNTDIVIEADGIGTCIIDAKFSQNATNTFMGKELLRSEHFYQIFTYVSNYTQLHPERKVSGIVIYPKVQRSLDVTFSYQGSLFRFVTVDLTQHWSCIEEAVFAIVNQYDTRPQAIEKEKSGGTALPIILA